MTRLEALEAVAEAAAVVYVNRDSHEAWSALQAAIVAKNRLDAIPAAPAQAQGETVEVAVWRLPGGEVRFLEVGSYDDVNRTYENPWNAWRRGGTARLPIRATVATEGGGE
jgi:hypothetical protein